MDLGQIYWEGGKGSHVSPTQQFRILTLRYSFFSSSVFDPSPTVQSISPDLTGPTLLVIRVPSLTTVNCQGRLSSHNRRVCRMKRL